MKIGKLFLASISICVASCALVLNAHWFCFRCGCNHPDSVVKHYSANGAHCNNNRDIENATDDEDFDIRHREIQLANDKIRNKNAKSIRAEKRNNDIIRHLRTEEDFAKLGKKMISSGQNLGLDIIILINGEPLEFLNFDDANGYYCADEHRYDNYGYNCGYDQGYNCYDNYGYNCGAYDYGYYCADEHRYDNYGYNCGYNQGYNCYDNHGYNCGGYDYGYYCADEHRYDNHGYNCGYGCF